MLVLTYSVYMPLKMSTTPFYQFIEGLVRPARTRNSSSILFLYSASGTQFFTHHWSWHLTKPYGLALDGSEFSSYIMAMRVMPSIYPVPCSYLDIHRRTSSIFGSSFSSPFSAIHHRYLQILSFSQRPTRPSFLPARLE